MTDSRSAAILGLLAVLIGGAVLLLMPKREAPAAVPVAARAAVTEIIESGQRESNGVMLPYQKIRAMFLEGRRKGQTTELEIGADEFAGERSLVAKGDRIRIGTLEEADGGKKDFLYGPDRTRKILALFAIFAAGAASGRSSGSA
jgi:hypothetical protein